MNRLGTQTVINKMIVLALVVFAIFVVLWSVFAFDVPGKIRDNFPVPGRVNGDDGSNGDTGELCEYKVAKVLRSKSDNGREEDYVHFCLNQNCEIDGEYKISYFYFKTDSELFVDDDAWTNLILDDKVGEVSPRGRLILNYDELGKVSREAFFYPEPLFMWNLDSSERVGNLICRGSEIDLSDEQMAGVTWNKPIYLDLDGTITTGFLSGFLAGFDAAQYRYSPYTQSWEILPEDWSEAEGWEEWYLVEDARNKDVEDGHLAIVNRLILLDEEKGFEVFAEYLSSGQWQDIDKNLRLIFPSSFDSGSPLPYRNMPLDGIREIKIPENYKEIAIIKAKNDNEERFIYRRIRFGDSYKYEDSKLYIDLVSSEIKLNVKGFDIVVGNVEPDNTIVITVDPMSLSREDFVSAFLIPLKNSRIKAGKIYKIQ